VRKGPLHITNGDSVSLSEADVPGEVLTWKDALHDGPVPTGLSLEELSEVRARFIADSGWGDFAAVRNDFANRNRTIFGFADHEEVTLWFEHDLYDQLQLIQILAWFCERDPGQTKISLICTNQYLGPLSPEQLTQLYPARHDISERNWSLAEKRGIRFDRPIPLPSNRY
jgi:hypothetical protein